MSKKDNNGLSAIEWKSKTVLDKYEAKFYRVVNRELAIALIKMGKYQYFTEREPHFKTGKIVTVFYFEMARGIHDDVRRIREELNEKYKNKKKKVK